MKLTKQKMIDQITEEIIQHGDCECDDGKSCAFCFALILKDLHADWKFDGVKRQVVKNTKRSKQ